MSKKERPVDVQVLLLASHVVGAGIIILAVALYIDMRHLIHAVTEYYGS